MQRILVAVIALTIGIALGAGVVLLTRGRKPPQSAIEQAAPLPASTQPQPASPQTRYLYAAERSLKHAESRMEKSGHSFGGHRAKALQYLKQAQNEVQEALGYASAHPGEFKESPAPAGKK